MMKTKEKLAFLFFLVLATVLSIVLVDYGMTSAVLDPQGIIALQQRDLIVISTLLMLIVVIPVLLLTFFVCYRYRANNKEAKYTPYWDHSYLAECIWWGFPFLIVFFLSILTWQTSHSLDPFKPLVSEVKPLRIQVVALQWKWLFIYPDQKIAAVNFVQFPEKTPIHFELTSDAPMNSFWIPALAGQIYAMPGMKTQLHLMADKEGSFRGSSANISGAGFAGMTFTAKSSTPEEFDKWVKSLQEVKDPLNGETYTSILAPSEYNPITTYVLKQDDLFDQIIMKYMMPTPTK